MLKCLCNTSNSNEIGLRSAMYLSNRTYKYKMCSECGSLFWNDIEGDNNYNSSYYSFASQENRKISLLQKKRYLSNGFVGSALRIVRPLSEMNSYLFSILRRGNLWILDFGSGSGNFSKFISALNYRGKVENYDPYYKGNSLKVYSDFNSLDWKKFDVIYSNQVFEHIVDVPSLLHEIHGRVKKGTHLIFSIPILGSLAREYGEFAYTLQIPDHKSLYTRKAILELLKSSSWELVYFKVENLHLEYSRKSNGEFPLSKSKFSAFDYTGGNNLIVGLTKN